MTAWRSLASWAAALFLASFAHAQGHLLQEKISDDSCFRIELTLSLKGRLSFQQEGKTRTLSQSANARHVLIERILQAGEQGMIGKTARYYKEAQVNIQVEKNKSVRNLRPERRTMIAQRGKDVLTAWCPQGRLTREELDLTQHFDTLALTGLLPGKKTAVGDTWKLHDTVAQALCWFDGLTSSSLRCTLVSANGKKAVVAINGHAAGIDDGATVTAKVEGSYQFDLEAGRIVSLQWKQKDEREQGPVSPALKADVTIEMKRVPLENVPAAVANAALGALPETPPAHLTALSYTDPKSRYSLSPARDWIMVSQTKQHAVFRILDRGEFIAQVTLTAWPKTQPGKHLSADDFKDAMAETPGWEVEQLVSEKEMKTAGGDWVYRLETTGKLNGLKTNQHFYLIAGPGGEQLVAAFTMRPAQASKLGERDWDLVQSIEFSAK